MIIIGCIFLIQVDGSITGGGGGGGLLDAVYGHEDT